MRRHRQLKRSLSMISLKDLRSSLLRISLRPNGSLKSLSPCFWIIPFSRAWSNMIVLLCPEMGLRFTPGPLNAKPVPATALRRESATASATASTISRTETSAGIPTGTVTISGTICTCLRPLILRTTFRSFPSSDQHHGMIPRDSCTRGSRCGSTSRKQLSQSSFWIPRMIPWLCTSTQVRLSLLDRLIIHEDCSTSPKIRFEGFNGEWSQRTLQSIVAPYTDYLPTPIDGYKLEDVREL